MSGNRPGKALIAARQWIPAEQIGDPAEPPARGLPGDLVFRTKGQLAIDLLTEADAIHGGGQAIDAFAYFCGGLRLGWLILEPRDPEALQRPRPRR